MSPLGTMPRVKTFTTKKIYIRFLANYTFLIQSCH